MQHLRRVRGGFAWLEILLAISIMAVILQLFPSVARVLDARNWTRGGWIFVNCFLVIALVFLRFAPDQVLEWRGRRDRRLCEKAGLKRRQAARDHREALQRIRQSRKRRLY